MGCLTAFVTAFYSFRLLYLGFLQAPCASAAVTYKSPESSYPTIIPLSALVLGSVLTGYGFSDLVVGQGSAALGSAVVVGPPSLYLVNGEFLPLMYKEVPALFSALGLAAALSVYPLAGRFVSVVWLRHPLLTSLLSKRWYFDTLYNSLITRPALGAGYHLFFRSIDKGLLERVGPTGVSVSFRAVSRLVRQAHTGLIPDYLTYILCAFASLSLSSGLWFL